MFVFDNRALLTDAENHVHLTPAGNCTIRVPSADVKPRDGVIELVRVKPERPGTQVTIDWLSAVSVGFGNPEVTLADLLEIHAYVVGIIESFAPEFPR